jgi:hypothetical protein
VTWTASLQSPSILASLMPPTGSATSLDFAVSDKQASYSSSTIPAGYYTLTLQLMENGFPIMGAVEVVRIVSGQLTSGIYDFSKVNMGTIEVNITPAMANPIVVSISGVPSTVAAGTSLTASASVSDGTTNMVYVWYLNGVYLASGQSTTFGSALGTGYYRLDVVAFTADGLRAGSATASFQITKAAAEEYFVSFKFDGIPAIFRTFVGAAVDTGWGHNGHVYDRTHIAGGDSPGEPTIDIALIGEPGIQPPPAGRYTFSDGVHEIHDVSYSTPEINCHVGGSGSATVVLTTVGGAGDFIEGTFSATVFEGGTLTSHLITEGAFRVKKLTFYTLSGTFASPGGVNVSNGIHAYLKLVPIGGLPTDRSVFWTRSNPFSGGSASYSVPCIAETYTAYAFIDMNGNAPGDGTAMPDSSDFYLQTGQQVTISGNQTLDLGPGGWGTTSPEWYWTCVGTWVNPANNGSGASGPPGKVVVTSDSIAFYDNDTDTTPQVSGSFAVADNWISSGAHYFKGNSAFGPPLNVTIYWLMCVSNNNTLEAYGSTTDYPTSLLNRPDSTFTGR